MENTLDYGSTAFILISTFLVLLMTPALAMFYSGMVRRTNVISTLMQCLCVSAVIGVLWVICGYSLAFGPDTYAGLIGNLDHLGFEGVSGISSGGIPNTLFATFQMAFAIIAGAIIVGSFVERIKFGVLLIFIVFWALLIYVPFAHWIWSENGWLLVKGSLDFAGGGVVHISAGVAGLVGAIMLGKRYGYATPILLPHNIPYTFLGAILLWFGWLGFNAGSALRADEIATNALLTSAISAFSGVIGWVAIEWIRQGRPSLLGGMTGAIAGLVAITPAAGFVSVLSSMPIGFISAILCYFFISYLKYKLGYDDALDAFGLHGVGGVWGGIATGLFADGEINPLVASGLGNGVFIDGNTHLIIEQLFAVVVCVAYALVVSYIIFKIISLFTPLRVEHLQEEVGLDMSAHGEKGYRIAE